MNLFRARFAVLILALAAAACAGPNKESADPILDHEAALAATNPAALGAPAPGSPEEKAAVARFEAFIADLSTPTIKSQIRSVYAPTLYFNDTLRTIRDVDTLEKYFLSSDDGMASYGLKVEQTISTPEGVFVRWRMDVVFRNYHKGQVQSSIGISHVRFDKDGRVVYHQDYWDSGSNFYEKFPIIGGMIRWIKSRL